MLNTLSKKSILLAIFSVVVFWFGRLGAWVLVGGARGIETFHTSRDLTLFFIAVASSLVIITTYLLFQRRKVALLLGLGVALFTHAALTVAIQVMSGIAYYASLIVVAMGAGCYIYYAANTLLVPQSKQRRMKRARLLVLITGVLVVVILTASIYLSRSIASTHF